MGLFSSIGSKIVDAVNDLLADTGRWAKSILDAGAHIYNKFVSVAYTIVTKDLHDATFNEFWNVIDKVNAVIVSVASVLLVMMFLYTLIQTSLQPRQEVDVKSLIADFIKMLLCNFLITQAVNVVSGIFSFGTGLARLAVGSLALGNSEITNSQQGISEAVAFPLEKGVSGISGLLIVIVALIGAIVMVACALLIVLEIYKRFFRIFVLIPFASISFSTSVMSDVHGNEIFKGYIKHIIAAAFESVIIVLCLVFCNALTAPREDGLRQSEFMESLFVFSDTDTNIHTLTIDDETTLEEFKDYAITMCFFLRTDAEREAMVNSSEFKSLGVFDMYTIEFTNGFTPAKKDSDNNLVNNFKETFNVMDPVYPVTVITGRRMTLGGGLVLILQAIFPMILTAGAIKEAPMYASKILGM